MQQLDERLFSRLAHDLKSPLASLRDALQLLESGKAGQLQPLQKEIVSLGLRNSELLSARLAKLAEWYRLTTGLAEFRKCPTSLSAIASRALTRVKMPLEGSRDWDYQQPAADLLVDGDPDKLKLMLTELLENGARFAEPGSRLVLELETGISESMGGQAAIFRVRHPGTALVGVEEHDLLEPFYPLRQERKTQSQGLGLGLPIAHAIARAHGGHLTWRCHRQHGTTFEVWLPLACLRAGLLEC